MTCHPPGLLLRRGQCDNGPSSRPLLSNRKKAVATAMILFIPAPQGHRPPSRPLLAPRASVSLHPTPRRPPAAAQQVSVVKTSEGTAAPAAALGSEAPPSLSSGPPGPAPCFSPGPGTCTKGSDSLKLPSAPGPLLPAFCLRKSWDVWGVCGCGGPARQQPPQTGPLHLVEVMPRGGWGLLAPFRGPVRES